MLVKCVLSKACSGTPALYKVAQVLRRCLGLGWVFGCMSPVDMIFKHVCVCVCVCVSFTWQYCCYLNKTRTQRHVTCRTTEIPATNDTCTAPLVHVDCHTDNYHTSRSPFINHCTCLHINFTYLLTFTPILAVHLITDIWPCWPWARPHRQTDRQTDRQTPDWSVYPSVWLIAAAVSYLTDRLQLAHPYESLR